MEAQQLLNIGLKIYVVSAYVYFAAFLVYCWHLLFKNSRGSGQLATVILIAAWLAHTVFMVLRGLFYYKQHGGFLLPATNMFEAISYMAWMIVLFYLIAQWFILKTPKFGAFALFVPIFLMTWNSQALVSTPGAGDPRDLFPSLKSNLLWIHVSCMFISYAIFALGATFAVLYILRLKRVPFLTRLDHRFGLRWLDDMSYRFTLFSFPVLSLGVFLGAWWASQAWGRPWAWDPKEVWALIVWLLYLAYIHLRIYWNWVGYRPALMNLIAFMAVMITFKGVNLLNEIFGLESIHAYTSGSLKASDWALMGSFTVITLGLVVAMFMPGPDERELEHELADFSPPEPPLTSTELSAPKAK